MAESSNGELRPDTPLKAHAGFVKVGDYAQFLAKVIHEDMLDWSWMRAWVYGTTGLELTDAQVKVLDALLVYTSYPDVRLWNNRVPGLTANARSPAALAISAGIAVSAGFVFGGQVSAQSIQFIRRALKARIEGRSLDPEIAADMLKYRRMAGYGRPFVSRDERIGPLLARMAELGVPQGPHLKLVFEVGELLQTRKAFLAPNYGSVMTALAADFGFSEENCDVFMTLLFVAGMPACYREWRQAPEGSLMRIPVTQVDYTGVAPRDLPHHN